MSEFSPFGENEGYGACGDEKQLCVGGEHLEARVCEQQAGDAEVAELLGFVAVKVV